MLDEGQIDVAVGFFPAVLADLTAQSETAGMAAFDYQRLYDGEYVCAMRVDHPLAKGPMTLKRYLSARHLLVSFSGRPYGFMDEALASLGKKRRVVLTVNQFFTAGRVVANSDLLTVLPRHFVVATGRAEELALRELPFDVPPVHVDALWHRRQGLRSDHAWLRLAVAASAAKAFASGER